MEYIQIVLSDEFKKNEIKRIIILNHHHETINLVTMNNECNNQVIKLQNMFSSFCPEYMQSILFEH